MFGGEDILSKFPLAVVIIVIPRFFAVNNVHKLNFVLHLELPHSSRVVQTRTIPKLFRYLREVVSLCVMKRQNGEALNEEQNAKKAKLSEPKGSESNGNGWSKVEKRKKKKETKVEAAKVDVSFFDDFSFLFLSFSGT